jgi:H+/Cl- antiporter ClcA
VAAIGTVYLGDWRDRQVTATLGCGVLSALLAGYYVVNISSGSGFDSEMASAAVSPGIGLFVSLAGSLILSWSAWQRRTWLQQAGTQAHQSQRQTAQQQPTQQSAGQQPTGQSASQQQPSSQPQQGGSQE